MCMKKNKTYPISLMISLKHCIFNKNWSNCFYCELDCKDILYCICNVYYISIKYIHRKVIENPINIEVERSEFKNQHLNEF